MHPHQFGVHRFGPGLREVDYLWLISFREFIRFGHLITGYWHEIRLQQEAENTTARILPQIYLALSAVEAAQCSVGRFCLIAAATPCE
jgi:hypothetical protein